MRVIGLFCVGSLLLAGSAVLAQAPNPQPVGTMSELMMSMTHPAGQRDLAHRTSGRAGGRRGVAGGSARRNPSG